MGDRVLSQLLVEMDGLQGTCLSLPITSQQVSIQKSLLKVPNLTQGVGMWWCWQPPTGRTPWMRRCCARGALTVASTSHRRRAGRARVNPASAHTAARPSRPMSTWPALAAEHCWVRASLAYMQHPLSFL